MYEINKVVFSDAENADCENTRYISCGKMGQFETLLRGFSYINL